MVALLFCLSMLKWLPGNAPPPSARTDVPALDRSQVPIPLPAQEVYGLTRGVPGLPDGIPIAGIAAKKVYLFFSHTIKGQPYNMAMLGRLMSLGCSLVDYERIVDEGGRRLVFFGRFAGLAGMIDTLWALGKRLAYEKHETPFAALKAALTGRTPVEHVHTRMAGAYYAMGNLGAAENELRKEIAVRPRLASPHANLAALLADPSEEEEEGSAPGDVGCDVEVEDSDEDLEEGL
mgnify:CR=1 FL=1